MTLRRRPVGYNSAQLAEVVVAKTARVRDHLLNGGPMPLDGATRTLAALAVLRPAGALRVLDFGGAAGYHYWIARMVLDAHLDWHVVETPVMVAAAEPTDELRFHAEIPDGAFDLVFTSGALQYTPDPLVALNALLDVDARDVFITRTALVEGAEPVRRTQRSRLAENGPGPLPPGFADRPVEYPMTAVPRAAFEAVLGGRRTVRVRFDEGGGMWGYAAS